MSDKQFGYGSMAAAFLLGGIVGATLAVFLTPVSGPEARRKVGEYKDHLKEAAEEFAHDTMQRAEDTFRRGKQYVDEKKAVATNVIEAGKEAYHKETHTHS